MSLYFDNKMKVIKKQQHPNMKLHNRGETVLYIDVFDTTILCSINCALSNYKKHLTAEHRKQIHKALHRCKAPK